MKYDKLLARIDNELAAAEHDAICNSGGQIEAVKALRAVVELHKPFMYDGRMGKYERCSFCTSEEEWLGEIYPCHTILVIEKELTK